MARTIVKCSGNTAKVFLLTFHLFLIFGSTVAFHYSEPSIARPILLLIIMLLFVSCCVTSACLSKMDCRKKNFELRFSKQPLVFTVKIPIERALRRGYRNHHHQFSIIKPGYQQHLTNKQWNQYTLPSYEEACGRNGLLLKVDSLERVV